MWIRLIFSENLSETLYFLVYLCTPMLHLMKPNNLKIGDIGVYRCTLNNSKIPLAGHQRLSQLQKWGCDFFCAKFPRLLHKHHLSQPLCAVIDVFLHKLMLLVQLCAVLEHYLHKHCLWRHLMRLRQEVKNTLLPHRCIWRWSAFLTCSISVRLRTSMCPRYVSSQCGRS